MTSTSSPVKILCVRARPNPECADVLHVVVDEWIHALALHCEVEVIEEDFDLIEVYERVKPDLLLFDAVHWGRPHRLTIANIDAYPELPRALYLNCDPHDPMRPLMLQALTTYGIDTIFTLGIEQLQQMHELRRFNVFPLPKFIDPAVFHDYGVERTIPVTIMSAHLFPSFYPWRAKVTEEIQKILPTLLYTHPGYVKGADNPFAIRGEKYARMIGQSQFCLADTTRLDYVVRKHLEIPASGSVLVSPRSDALTDYGFIDMENCVLGEGPALYRKIVKLASDPARYEEVRAKGHDLVHARYTGQSWTYILDWLAFRRRLQPGEMIQQDGIFGPFRIVAAGPDVPPVAGREIDDNPMSERLRAAREALLADGDLASAVDGLREVMDWIHHISEPWLMMGAIAFVLGDLDTAASWLAKRSATQGSHDASLGLLDPCEVAWLMLYAHLTDNPELLEQMSASAVTVPHVNIRRIQWLIDGERGMAESETSVLEGPLPDDCLSIHWLGDEDFESWFLLMQKILLVNGRPDMIEAKKAVALS